MNLKTILTESLLLYTIRVVIKVEKRQNRTDLFNKIRALPQVIIVEPENNEYLDKKSNDLYGFSLLKIKFVAESNPEESIDQIKNLAMIGDEDNAPIEGLIKFIYKPKSIVKVQ